MEWMSPQLAPALPVEGAVRGGAPEPAEGPLPDRPLRILHLEDSPSDAELVREHLALAGISCALRRVETEETYLEALHGGGIDLIVADFQLPGFDGLMAFAMARQLCPDVPFIMLTGKLGEDCAVDTLKLGVADYVLKQQLLTRLAPAVRRALQQQRERAERRDAQEQLRQYQQHLEELVARRTAELEERNAQLALANKDLELFVASATHDLRTPLVAIGGFARLVAKRAVGRIDDGDLELLERVVVSADRMERILNGLFGYFRASMTAAQPEPVDMDAVVREEFAGLQNVIAGRRVRLELSFLPAAHGDAGLLRQVVANLLANAVKYTAPRASAVVEVAGWEEPEATGYFVRDNGVGFDAGSADRVFELFHRLHDAREFPGTGVGLATVKRIVEKHGGRVWAAGIPGQGATFFFTLPKAAPGHSG
jgi:signal transduction histidine kinase